MKAVVDSGADTRYVNRIVSGVSDAVVQRLLDMAIEKLGPPPVRFAFLALGSEGREEQTLLTDQDNALLYDDPTPRSSKEVGRLLPDHGHAGLRLARPGRLRYCDGGVMAKNPRWNLPRPSGASSSPIGSTTPTRRNSWSSTCSSTSAAWTASSSSPVTSHLGLRPDGGLSAVLPPLRPERAALQAAAQPLRATSRRPRPMTGEDTQPQGSADADRQLLPALRPAAPDRLDEHARPADRTARRACSAARRTRRWCPTTRPSCASGCAGRRSLSKRGRKPTNLISPDELTSAEEARLKRLFSLSTDLRKKISYDFLGGIAGF